MGRTREDTARPMLTVEQTAALLAVSTKTVRRLLHRGELIGYRVGTAWRISHDDLEDYLRRRRGP